MTTDLAVQGELSPTSTLFGTDNPAEVVERAAGVAKTLADLVRRQNLIVRIGQSDHVRVEGWTLLGSMLGVFPIVEWTRPLLKDDVPNGWEARVVASTRTGEIVGAAEAECTRDENAWGWTPKNRYGKPLEPRDDYALRSMAQTRAVSKALRLPLGFVMQLAGFDPTPADEMPVVEHKASGGAPTAGADPVPTAGEDEPSAPPVDMYDPDIPFGDAPAPQLQPPVTGPQKKKLNVLIGKLRPDHISTLQLWQSMGREPIPSEDGTLHWSPLRDSLTKQEASDLIERLDAYAIAVSSRG